MLNELTTTWTFALPPVPVQFLRCSPVLEDEFMNGSKRRGSVHMNTAEGFMSLLKRGIVGTFHHVGKGNLGRDISEFEFRYNVRHLADKHRPAVLVQGAEGKRLTYKQPAGEGSN